MPSLKISRVKLVHPRARILLAAVLTVGLMSAGSSALFAASEVSPADLEFSAHIIRRSEGRSWEGQLFVKRDRYRLEHRRSIQTDLGYVGVVLAADSKQAEVLREAQEAFEHKQYDRALALVDPLLQGGTGPLNAHELKVRSLIKLGRPMEALTEYERLESRTGRQQISLLRDVAVGFIIPSTKDMREQMRGAAYTALKELDSDEAIPYFEDGLSDGSGLVRTLAVEGLGRLEAGRRSARLRQALEDQAAMVRTAALKALGRSRDRSVVGLLERSLQDEQPTVRVTASGAMAMLGRSEGWNRVRQAAAASNPEERGTALRMLGELKDRRALPILGEALGDPQPSVRGAAAVALGDLGLSEAAPSLASALSDPIPAVRTSAAISLGELRAPESVPVLKKTLADTNPAVRAAAVSALLRLGVPYDEIAEVIRELIRNVDPGIRAAAAKALAGSRGHDAKDAIGMLQLLLEDPLPRPRIAAARSLGQIGDRKLIGTLKKALRDQDEAVRATAGGALGRVLTPLSQNK